MKHLIYLLIVFLFLIPASFPVSAVEPKEADSKSLETFYLHFPGGTFMELIEAVQVQTGHRPNVIVGTGARDLEVPEFALASVTIDQVFRAVGDVLGISHSGRDPTGASLQIRQDTAGIWIFEMTPPLGQGRFLRPPSPPAPPPPVTAPRVFQIGPFLDEYQLADITTAIETAWEMAGKGEDGRLRFHEETKLLYVRGTSPQVVLVELVLTEMRGELESLKERRQAREQTETRLEKVLEGTRRELEAAPAILEAMKEDGRIPRERVVEYERRIDELVLSSKRLQSSRDRYGDHHPVIESYLKSAEMHLSLVERDRLIQATATGAAGPIR